MKKKSKVHFDLGSISLDFVVLIIFRIMEKEGEITEREMFTTFNMGIGMMVFIDRQFADKAMEHLKTDCFNPFLIGEVTSFDSVNVTIL